MTNQKHDEEKLLASDEISAVTGGISIDYDYCQSCDELTSLAELAKNHGYCNECVRKGLTGGTSGGATGGW